MSKPADVFNAILWEAQTVVIGNESIFEGLTIALLTDGNVLLEGVPGVAKTTIARVFARASGLQYRRIQMTPDMLPADITGTMIYRQTTGEFELQRGPVFANVVLADEINRATPKSQSALLEAMEEQTVTIESETLSLPEPFILIATQNPIEMEGVFELPEAQRDRFQLKYTVELPDTDDERRLLDRADADPGFNAADIEQVVTEAELAAATDAVDDVHVASEIKEYVLDLVSSTRQTEQLRHGGSPRASLSFLQAAKARAAIHDRSYVIPEDIKSLAFPVLRHRVIRSTDAELAERTSEEILQEVIESVTPPGAQDTDVRFGDDETAQN
jgi:MoxR-like ATPase